MNLLKSRRLQHRFELLTSPALRKAERELHRLKVLPRFQAAETTLLGAPLRVIDGLSYFDMHEQIFGRECYYFESQRCSPYIIDAGANIGVSTLYFKHLFPESRVLAFEADPRIYAVLERNTRDRAGVERVGAAVWSADTELPFRQHGSDAGRLSNASDGSAIRVRAVRLKRYLEGPVALLKMDIEGAETEVLCDCADALGDVDHLFVEYHGLVDRRPDLDRILGVLAAAGFRYHIESPRRRARPFVDCRGELGIDLLLNIYAFRPA